MVLVGEVGEKELDKKLALHPKGVYPVVRSFASERKDVPGPVVGTESSNGGDARKTSKACKVTRIRSMFPSSC